MKTGATGAEMIAGERRRQIEKEGWTAEHDDEHDHAEMAWAAVCYAAPDSVFVASNLDADFEDGVDIRLHDPWPWDGQWDKRRKHGRRKNGRIRQLVIAGALIAAEIDRLLRELSPGDGAEA